MGKNINFDVIDDPDIGLQAFIEPASKDQEVHNALLAICPKFDLETCPTENGKGIRFRFPDRILRQKKGGASRIASTIGQLVSKQLKLFDKDVMPSPRGPNM